MPNVGSLPIISISSPHTRKTPIAARWCCQDSIKGEYPSNAGIGLRWKLIKITSTMIANCTQFSQLQKYAFRECMTWNISLDNKIEVEPNNNIQTTMVVHVIWHCSSNGLVKQLPLTFSHFGIRSIVEKFWSLW